jgi:hypothetical protein
MQERTDSGGSRPSHRELAFHEAGHAIVAALLGQEVEWVAIDKASGCGEAEPRTNPFCRLDEPCESRRRVIIAMAGSAAQCASKQAKLRVSAPRRIQLIGSTLAAHAVRAIYRCPRRAKGRSLAPQPHRIRGMSPKTRGCRSPAPESGECRFRSRSS